LNRTAFISALQQPHTIDEYQTAELKMLLETYPYCATLQNLYIKGLQNSGNFEFDTQLSLAALLAADRNKLYELCYQKQLQELLINVEEELQTTPDAPFENEVETNSSNEQHLTIHLEEVEEKTKIKDDLLKELETNILLEAINQSIAKDVEEEIQLLEEEKLDENNSTVLPEHTGMPESIKPSEHASPKKFSDWLQVMQPISEKTSSTIEIHSKETPISKNLASPQSLIDRFLQLEDTSIRVKKEPATPQDIARLSLIESEEYVTETLANIYASQHNYAKSIKIYEQLILKIPEKKTFFASRIRFLREKMEYDK
jgi:hypothetical protein